jgi:hypothetical protein
MAHMSTRQYARLVHEWVVGIGLSPPEYGTHSLRRTKASIIYKATGNLRAVQILLGHAQIESTVRYLNVDVEDALELADARRSELTHFRPLRDYEAPPETCRSFSITDGRPTTFPNRKLTAPAYPESAVPVLWR